MTKLATVFSLILLSSTIVVSGCDLAQPQNKGKEKPAAVPEALPQEEDPQNNREEVPAPNPNNEDTSVVVKAEVGMGTKGKSYGKPTGSPMDFITVPISAGFRAQERIMLQRIDHAMNLYKAGNDNQGPASHEEFMEKIIKANGIILTQLPPGQEYLYDPEDGELKIRQPKNVP